MKKGTIFFRNKKTSLTFFFCLNCEYYLIMNTEEEILGKGQQIKGLRVINFHDGKEVGRVGDLLIDVENGMLQGITIENRGIIKNKYVKREHIVQVGRDAVLINGLSVVEDYDHHEQNKLSWQNKLGKNVFREGTDIGTIQDMLFDLPEGGSSA